MIGKPGDWRTPGPWRIAHKEDSIHWKWERITIVDAEDNIVCIIPNNRDITEAMENAMAIKAVPQLLAVLGTIEWINRGEHNRVACPRCNRRWDQGHAPKCPLAKALRDAKGEE